MTIGLAVMGVVAAAALVWSVRSLNDLRDAQTWLQTNGSSAVARVEKVHRQAGEWCASLDVEFVSSDGRVVRVSGLERSFKDDFSDYTVGDRFAILYDPKDVTLVRPAAGHCGDRYGEGRRWAGIVISIAALIGIAFKLARLYFGPDPAEPRRVWQAPPGWPPRPPSLPPGFVPPQGWQPDPSWPPAPDGWTYWVRNPARRWSWRRPPAERPAAHREGPPTGGG